MAKEKTVHRVISSVEDDDGNLIYADVSLNDCANRRRALLDADPEYEIGWANEIATWRRQGYLRERIWGRRREFLDGEPEDVADGYTNVGNEIVNFPIQSGSAALIHDATFDMLKVIPFERWGRGTGLIHQGHDALVVECPIDQAKWVAGVLVECMTRTYPGLDVQFKAEAKIGYRWSEV
jgi:DNA polymerase I-like protein with 3'-5' exonuclease and polymerase domains